MIASYEQLTAALLPGVEFDQAIQEAVMYLKPNLTSRYFTPTETLAAVAQAGFMYATSDRGLANDMIALRGMSLDTPERLLVNLVNASNGGVLRNAPPDRFNLPLAAHSYSGCADSEVFFAYTLSTIQHGVPNKGCQIFANKTGEPLLVRKRVGNAIALSLAPIMLNKVAFPAGSVFELQTHGEPRNTPCIQPYATEVKSMDEVAGLRFMRLSALALSLERRQTDFANFHTKCDARARSLWAQDAMTREFFESCAPELLAQAVQLDRT